MGDLETPGNGDKGNTNYLSPPAKRAVPAKQWCFTAWQDMEGTETFLESLKKYDSIKYYYGEEITPSTGVVHYQGFLTSDTKIRPIEKFKTKNVHWEKMRGDIESNITYCSKDGKVTTNMRFKKKVQDPLEGLTPYSWQSEILDIVSGSVDPRKIYWYWESTGGTGKSALCKHICMNHQALCVGGKGPDIKYAVVSYLEERDLDIVIYDIPRNIGNNVSYSSIEEIKNGCLFSTKYESGMKIFNSPHIIVFANEPPEVSNLSADRWVVVDISER